MAQKEHPYIDTLRQCLAEGKIGRRDFLRSSTLLGLSAAAAYAFVGRVTGEPAARPARAAMPKGGRLLLGGRVKEVQNPHTFSWGTWDSNITRQIIEYLTKTGSDNVTRPYLLEGWEASDDLRTWTLNLRRDVKWHSGRPLTSEDVIWNLKRVLDPAVGSSVVGLMKGYMLEEYETGEKDDKGNPKTSVRLWDANAVEKVDDHTVRLNCKVPQVAVPEHLFHYPLPILDPAEGGVFGVGSNGTGAFELVEMAVGEKAVVKARPDYWGEGPYLDEIRFIDLGDDPSAPISALGSKQVHGLVLADPLQFKTLSRFKHVAVYQVPTAETAVMRMKVNEAPFDDPRVRQALRFAVDPGSIYKTALQGLGTEGEHHHVAAIHPEYAPLPKIERDVEKAKRLLAEAGHPDGLETEIICPKDPPWALSMVQVAVEQWREAGIRVKINLMPGAQYWDVWDKVPFGTTQWYHRPLGIMNLGLAYRTGVPWNESSYANPEFDRLLTAAEGILDPDERRKIVKKIEMIMQEDGPLVQPLFRNNFTFMDKRVKGFAMHPTTYIFGNEIALEG
ncbi:MAG: ABC transporter substrate-binding protein [Kiloniellaceae bacterium]